MSDYQEFQEKEERKRRWRVFFHFAGAGVYLLLFYRALPASEIVAYAGVIILSVAGGWYIRGTWRSVWDWLLDRWDRLCNRFNFGGY